MSPVALRVLAPCHTGMSTTFGLRFRELRERLGLTQQQIGDRAGYGRDAINKVEGGKSQVSSARMRDGLADALGLARADLDAFIGGRITVDEAVARSGSREPSPAPVVPITAAAPRAETRVVYDDEDALEATITQALDPAHGHLLRDARSVQEAMRPLRFKHAADVPGVEAVRRWLDAAAALRRRGEPVTAAALLVMVSSGDPDSDRARSWQDEAREASERADRGG